MINSHLWTIRRWTCQNKYYLTYLSQDLFNNWVLVRVWGDQNSKRGNKKTEIYDNYSDALKQIKAIAALRKKHKYT
jgi:predicted DNA-binding WGR domain protein